MKENKNLNILLGGVVALVSVQVISKAVEVAYHGAKKGTDIVIGSIIGGLVSVVGLKLVSKTTEVACKYIDKLHVTDKEIMELTFDKVFKDNYQILNKFDSVMSDEEMDEFIKLSGDYCNSLCKRAMEYNIDKFLLEDIILYITTQKYETASQLLYHDNLNKMVRIFGNKYDDVSISYHHLRIIQNKKYTDIRIDDMFVSMCYHILNMLPDGILVNAFVKGSDQPWKITVLNIYDDVITTYGNKVTELNFIRTRSVIPFNQD